MSKLMEVFAAYKDLSFTDRIVFYTTLSNNVNVHEDNLQDFLIETRINDKMVYSVSFVVIARSHLSLVPVLSRQALERT